MRAIKFTTKLFAAAAILAVVFGPFATYAQVGDNSLPGGDPTANDAAANAATKAAAQGIAGQTQQPTLGYNPDLVASPVTGQVTSISTGQTVPVKKDATSSNDCSGITGCLASMVYYIGPGLASWVASWAGYFFDLVVRISLSSSSYSLQFITNGWNLVLSIANMFFIFLLVGAAIVILLKADTARTMQTLAWIIAIALLVNFSFFFTRVIIDAGNILGTQFYNAVAVNTNNIQTGDQSIPATPDIAQPIMRAVGVESLLGAKSFGIVSSQLGSAPWSTLLVLTVIFLFAAVMFWVLAIALLMMGLKFLLRIIGLWLIIVASPLAFVAQTMGSTRHLFQRWLKALVGLSMYPPVILFMFWVLIQFALQLSVGINKLGLGDVNTAIGEAAAANGGSLAATPLLVLIANVSVRMLFMVTLIYLMLKVGEWVIEQTGGMVGGSINFVSGAVLGGGFRTAARAGAFAGRNTVGRGAFAAAQSGTLKTWAANSRIGNTLLRSTTALSRSNFDIRSAPGAGTAGRGISTLPGFSNVNAGRASQRNFSQSVDDKAKRLEEQARVLKAGPTEAAKLQQREIERMGGKEVYSGRVAELERRYSKFSTFAHQLSAKAAGTDNIAEAAELKTAAGKARAAATESKQELDQMQLAGARIADINSKTRAAAFANRLDGTPFSSHGAIVGAAAIRQANAAPTGDKKKESAVKPSSSTTAPATPAPTAPTPPTPAAPAAAASAPKAASVTSTPVVAMPAPAAPAPAPAPAPARPLAPAAEARTFTQNEIREMRNAVSTMRDSLSKELKAGVKDVRRDVASAGHKMSEKMDDVAHRQELKTLDHLKKIERKITEDLHDMRGHDPDSTPPHAVVLPKTDETDGDSGPSALPKAA